MSVLGLQPVLTITDLGINLGQNPAGFVPPGGKITYTWYAEKENTFLLHNVSDNVSNEGIGTSALGLFGAVNVEPKGSEWYRSQLTRDEMNLASIGKTSDGHPLINYDARYPEGHNFAGVPILKILDGGKIVHSDLNAIITGPDRGLFSEGTYPKNPSYPNRQEPFREFTAVFHDEIAAIQAFEHFESQDFGFTLHGVRDGFAINYGSGGAGAEILANRLGVGPMWNCPECKYEEFFLTSWAVGDPAMVVDIPANTAGSDGNLIKGPKATKALYPDDPSNVFHSYLNDRTKIRNLSVGKEHHIFHLHAHQWLFTPDDDNSSYLDSQAIGPGTSYTYEIAFNGSGNRNKTPGDAIFHCHFYPHFAQGMWALWRNHDTFESGTEMEIDAKDELPIPASGSRALPDGEIKAGTPVPALVPIPDLPMAPMPQNKLKITDGQIELTGTGNPGYPFNISALAGHRPPTPPLDIIDDGGLPRHIITGGETEGVTSAYDFSKELKSVTARFLPENGTDTEKASMEFHAKRSHESFKPSGEPGSFTTNGLPPAPGAPYADPCVSDSGQPTGNPRIYKAAAIQLDIKLNKAGWHFPQSRILTLWDDVGPTLEGKRPPEPFVMRTNTNDCISYYHTNLIPSVYEQDAFQVRTPTDVIGQHIHLVKFDVTSADGSGNGFNYEDGTFSPQEVEERIKAIRTHNQCTDEDTRNGSIDCPVAKNHPFFGTKGARTTIQRWFVDPIVNNSGQDRTLGNVYTHDHFGPSTHQQAGLYAVLVTEPEGSKWRNPENGKMYGVKQDTDGGPTSWWADILTLDPKDSFREYLLEFADFQLAYLSGRGINGDGKPIPDPMGAINQPHKDEVGLPDIFAKPKECPNGQPFEDKGCPESISADDVGTFTINYRNEPVPLRVRDPLTNNQSKGSSGDLSFAFSSSSVRTDNLFNTQPTFYPPLTSDIRDKDPFTPLLRAYDNDKIKIKIIVGATEEGHNASVLGLKWLEEPSSINSGWRNSQMLGISEQFSLETPIIPNPAKDRFFSDYLYTMDSSVDGYWNGAWGILRSYPRLRNDLLPLPNNQITPTGHDIKNKSEFEEMCPQNAPKRNFDVSAVAAKNALPGKTLVYNGRKENFGQLHDPTAILYVRSEDLDASGRLKAGVPVEPLILRASAGDCIKLTLRNKLPFDLADLSGFNAMPPIIDGFNANDVTLSRGIGLRPQMVAFDVGKSSGANIGRNPIQTIALGSKEYTWYAGDVKLIDGKLVGTPVEFGATNLISSDPIKHSSKGAIGGLIIEPEGSIWKEDQENRASATVTKKDGTSFRDFVLIFQDDLNLRFGNGDPLPFISGEEDSEDSGLKALNYKTEPLWFRLGISPETSEEGIRDFDFTSALSNGLLKSDPVTPIFQVQKGTPFRIRLLQPGGHPRNHVFSLYGHLWQREPYINSSSSIGENPFSQWYGSQGGHGPSDHFDIVPLNGAGGKFGIPGDYLFRDLAPGNFYNGVWGILRVLGQDNISPAPTFSPSPTPTPTPSLSDNPPPPEIPAPSNLTVSRIGQGTVNLSWKDNSGNETEFRIERRIGSFGTFSQTEVLGQNQTTFTQSNLNLGVYYYKVRACNTSGCSDFTNAAYVLVY